MTKIASSDGREDYFFDFPDGNLGTGRAVSPVSDEGLVAKGVPLDREKAYGRSVRTGYFNGKAIRNLRTGELGRIKNVNLDSSVALDTNPGLREGDRFELLDIQSDDTVEIPGGGSDSTSAADRHVRR